ncbi:MAG: hypothetical protein FWE22_02460 [Firmicutes bacterium]|nr:hypothetical protein [Bacillota bacterium]
MLDLIFAIVFLAILFAMFIYVLCVQVIRVKKKPNINVIEVTSNSFFIVYVCILLAALQVIISLLVFSNAEPYLYPIIAIFIVLTICVTRLVIRKRVVVNVETQKAIIFGFFIKETEVNIQDIIKVKFEEKGFRRYYLNFYTEESSREKFTIDFDIYRDKGYRIPVSFLIYVVKHSKCKVFQEDGKEMRLGKNPEKKLRDEFVKFSYMKFRKEMREIKRVGISHQKKSKDSNYKEINDRSKFSVSSFVTGELESELLEKFECYLENITENRKISDYLTFDEFFVIFENMACYPFVFIHEGICFVISNGENMGCDISFTSESDDKFDEKAFNESTKTYETPQELFENARINEKSLKEIWNELTAG